MLSSEMWIVICVILLLLKYVIIEPLEDKKLYKMFESRDKIALKAYRGEINQECEEYNYAIKTINFELYYMQNDYDFFIILNNLLREPYQRRKKVDSIFKKIRKDHDLNEAFKVSYEAFIKQLNIRLFVFTGVVLLPIYWLLTMLSWLVNILDNISKKVEVVTKEVIAVYESVGRGTTSCTKYLKRNPYKLY